MNFEQNERTKHVRRTMKQHYVATLNRWRTLHKLSKQDDTFIELIDRRIIKNIEKKCAWTLASGFFVGIVFFAASYNWILRGAHKWVKIPISIVYAALPIQIGHLEYYKNWILMGILTTKYKNQINQYNHLSE